MSDTMSVTDIRPGAVIAIMKTVVSVVMNAEGVLITFDDGTILPSSYDGAIVVEKKAVV